MGKEIERTLEQQKKKAKKRFPGDVFFTTIVVVWTYGALMFGNYFWWYPEANDVTPSDNPFSFWLLTGFAIIASVAGIGAVIYDIVLFCLPNKRRSGDE